MRGTIDGKGACVAAGLALIAGLAAGGAAPAWGQAAASEGAESGIGDIVVTARRREESLQSVPISVQAFSGAALQQRNVLDAVDLQRLVPSLTTYQQARDETTLSIRGLSSAGASAQGQNPRVTSYFAQVPLQTGDNGGPGRFFDLQNVQVLKGPQGTLFGRNSTGGAVLYEPTRPKQSFGGYVTAQYGRFDDREIEGALNLPVSDIVAVRLAAKAAKRDGFTTNITTGQKLDDRNYVGARASVLITPGGGFENLTIFDFLRSKTHGSSQQIAGYNPDKVFVADLLGGAIPGRPIPLTLAGNGPSLAQFAANPAATIPLALAAGRVSYFPDPLLPNQLATQQALGPRIAQSAVDGLNHTKAWGITNISTIELTDSLTVKNIFGYRRFKQLTRYDMDGTALPLLDQTTPDGWTTNLQQVSDELQVQGKAFEDRLDFTVGGFLLDQKSPKPQVLTQVSVGVPSRSISDVRESSQAVFGQATYDLSDLLLDGLSVTAGYRYTHDYRAIWQQNYRDPAGRFPPSSCSLVRGCPSFTEAAFNASSYNFGIDYKLGPQTLIYFSHRRGYRAGGLNPQALDFGVAYGPEHVTDFELGLKTDFRVAGMKGRFNLAAYHTKLKDAQVSESFSTINPVTGQLALINLIVNAASATIKGIEADATLVPVRGLELSASYAYTDAGYGSFIDVATGLEESNRPFPFLAKHRLNLGAIYTLPTDERLGEISFGVNYAYSSSYTLSVFYDPLAVDNGYSQVDLRADWKNVAGSRISAGAFVTNVTKALYKIGGVPIYSVLGTTSVLYNEPRTWGIQLRYAFGE